MKLCKLVFVALVVVCVTARGALAENENIEEIKKIENLAIENGAQKRLVQLPAMIDFARFKQLYDKHYPSALVAMNRAKLFAINAYNVFISRVKYVWRKSSSYLVINQYSDMTALERHKMLDIYLGPPGSRKILYEAAEDEPEAGKSRKKREAESDKLELEARPLTASDLIHEMPQLPEQVARSIADGSTDIEDMLHTSGGQEAASNDSSVSGENHRSRRTKRVPDEVYLDLRTTGCIQPARQQQTCGSCYAMAATALFEYAFCRQSEAPIDFSIQYVIDCGPLFRQLHPNPDYFQDLNGCGGGREPAVGEFYSSFGLHLEDEYPYSAVDQECLVPFDRDEYKLGRVRVENGKLRQYDLRRLNGDRIQRLMASKGPLSVVTQIDDTFPFYGGGVQEFTCEQFEFGHSLVLVGRGIEDNREYWIMRNSFGQEWGENGYWRVATDITSCFVLLHSLQAPEFTLNQDYVPL